MEYPVSHEAMMDIARSIAKEEALKALARQKHDYYSTGFKSYGPENRRSRTATEEDGMVPFSVAQRELASEWAASSDVGGQLGERDVDGIDGDEDFVTD